ncbi:Holliday junction branch migration DNA helicase RuvB [Chlamydiales bacterium]|nr:Holliday junction branch migration DNA helicase RuvB [Chlamydiales bacterium]
MNLENKPFIESTFCQEDQTFEVPLRPQSLQEFIGQDTIKERLSVFTKAAQFRNEALGHCLFSGPPGLGKTTLAHILANQMGTQCIVTSGPAIDKAGDLAGILTNLNKGDILFIDEIHRLQRSIEEYLYPAMEDFSLDLIIDSGPSARSVQLEIKPFTLVGATTRSGLLSEPLRTRFAFSCRLDYYNAEILQSILMRTANLLRVTLSKEAALEIAKRGRGTPRIANHLLRWVRDYAQVNHSSDLTLSLTTKALEMLSIDHLGLDEMDKKLLHLMVDNYSCSPVGLSTLAAASGEEANTIEEVYEPYLLLQGLIKRTPRGRVITEKGIDHLKHS